MSSQDFDVDVDPTPSPQSDLTETPSLPYQLGPYRLERVLGRGGMGIVYVAYDQRLDRRVGVKRILAGSDDPRRRKRLRREARTTAQLAHPAIVQVFDLIEDDECDWIVMELVEGTSLARLLDRGPLDLDTTLRIAHQVAEGLVAAHNLGIVHRDLKTENVMIMPDGRAKILDFGIAKQLDFAVDESQDHALSKTGEILGTSRAMAPEQARGISVGPRSDLFSLGVLIYETLTGVSPFRGDSPVSTLAQVMSHHPQPIGELAAEAPPALGELVERLLRKSAELRPASAGEVVRELADLIASRRSEIRDRPSGHRIDTDPTLDATEFLESEALAQHTSSRGTFGWVVGFPSFSGRAMVLTAFVVMAVIVILAAVVRRVDPVDADGDGDRIVADDPLSLYDEGVRLLHRIDRPQNVDEAIAIFRRLLEMDPGSAAAHAGMARAYWEKARNASAGGDPVFLEQAESMAREAVRLGAYLADARTNLGLVHYSRGRYEEAAKELERALELEPTHAEAHYGLGKLAESQGQDEEAESLYRRAIELQPLPLYCDAFGSLLYDQGRYDDAAVAFRQSLAIAPDNIHALRNLGALYYAQGRIDEAAVMMQSALKIRPNASLYSNLGTIFFSQGLYAKAVTAFEDALRMEGASNRYIFWLNLGDAQRQVPGKEAAALQSYQVAIRILDDSIESAPGDVRLLSRRALAHARTGSRTDSLADIASTRELGTGSDLYSLFRLVVATELCGDREQALIDLEAALRSGFSRSEALHEPDLQALRADPQYHHMMAELDADP